MEKLRPLPAMLNTLTKASNKPPNTACTGLACGKFTEAERFDTVERYEAQIKISEYYAARPGLIPPEQPALAWKVGQLPDLKRRRAWREKRQSPPRCIRCGSAAVTVLWGDSDVFDVPGLGTVRCRMTGLCSSEGPSCHFWYFTPEGMRISEPSLATRRRSGSAI